MIPKPIWRLLKGLLNFSLTITNRLSTFSTYTDAQLLGLIKIENHQAFRELYNRYWDKLLYQAFLKLNSTFEAEEVVQQVFINIWNRRSTISVRTSFKTYISVAVKYEIYLQLSKRLRNVHETITAANEMSSNESPVAQLDYQFLCDQLEQSITQLPEKCQLVFRMSREEGLSARQIAGKLDLSEKTVEAHITKALRLLRHSLQQFFFLF